MFHRSERLFLRPGWTEDWDELTERLDEDGAESVLARRGLEPAAAFDPARERLAPAFLLTRPFPDRGGIVGTAGLRRCGGDAEPGVWIARRFRGRGYAAEALCALVGVARGLGHARMVARQPVDSPAVARILARSGFRPIGGEPACGAAGHWLPVRTWALDLAGETDLGGEPGARRVA